MSAELWAMLLSALIAVESPKTPAQAEAAFRREGAIGILQIHREYVADVNRIYRLRYTHEEMADPAKARVVAGLYLVAYGERYERLTGKPMTMEVLARCHNGGPDGWKKPATDSYWLKVKAEIDRGFVSQNVKEAK